MSSKQIFLKKSRKKAKNKLLRKKMRIMQHPRVTNIFYNNLYIANPKNKKKLKKIKIIFLKKSKTKKQKKVLNKIFEKMLLYE